MLSRIPTHYFVASSAWVNGAVNAVCILINIRLLSSGLSNNDYAAYSVLIALMTWFCLGEEVDDA